MNNSLYPKLAATNIKKNSKMYVPYILTCIFTIAMFYVIIALANNKGLANMPGAYSVQQILMVGTNIMAILSGIFIFYTNSFLIKQRKKEFGLFNILGMEKRHISKILFFENTYVALGSLIVGLVLGMLLNKLMFLLLLKILDFEVKMGIDFSVSAFIFTIVLFITIFTLVLINTIRIVYFSKPIELIKGGKIGEKEPKNKWILTILGVISLGGGYYISVSTTNPLAAINLFFVAVILVCIGTYYLFTAGSITLLKILRKNKNYYYKTNHFVSISTMMYRMKQNAVGLSNICILSTAVLVMISSTVSLYVGSEDILRTRYPRNIVISKQNPSLDDIKYIEDISKEVLNKNNLVAENLLNYKVNLMLTISKGNEFEILDEFSPELMMNSNVNALNVILLDDYNRIMGESKTLNSDEILIYSNRDIYEGDSLTLGNVNYKIKEKVDKCIQSGIDLAMIFNTHYIIVKDDEVLNEILSLPNNIEGIQYFYGFNLEKNEEFGIKVYNDIISMIDNGRVYVEASQIGKEGFYGMYGGYLFLGIFLGTLFIMATILIMYYKQVSEGYDDKERYSIMKKVGMDKEEIKSTINSQVLTVFFMPLIFAIIHICFAFPVIKRILAMLNFTNVRLYAICTGITILGFAICYGIVYFITAKVYYKTVK